MLLAVAVLQLRLLWVDRLLQAGPAELLLPLARHGLLQLLLHLRCILVRLLVILLAVLLALVVSLLLAILLLLPRLLITCHGVLAGKCLTSLFTAQLNCYYEPVSISSHMLSTL